MADPFARNPAFDDLRARNKAVATIATREGPAPTLFGSGDLPRYTASGNPPAALLDLPWKLRHAAARASQPEWARLFAEYGKGVPDGDVLAEFAPEAKDPANDDYTGRVRAWACGTVA
jgi:hypothetical protein